MYRYRKLHETRIVQEWRNKVVYQECSDHVETYSDGNSLGSTDTQRDRQGKF